VLPVAEEHLAGSDLPASLGARREAELELASDGNGPAERGRLIRDER
jgi:hypothetical protein